MGNPFRRNIILLVACLIGALLIPRLSIQLNPSPRSQNLTVSYQYPNASPEVIEKEITSRLESTFATIRGLQEIKSTSDIGIGRINLEFDRDLSIEKKRMEIAMLIRQVYPRLSSEVSYPQIAYQSDFEEYKSLLEYTLASDLPSNEMESLVNEHIITPLSHLKGVRNIEVSGLPKEEYQITLDESLQKTLGIQTSDIQNAIQQFFTKKDVTLAKLTKKDNRIGVSYGSYAGQELSDRVLLNIPLVRHSDRTILLSDLARVKKTIAKPKGYFRVNGQTAIILTIYADQKNNQIQLAKILRGKVSDLQTDLENKIRFDLIHDETEFLTEELQKIGLRTGTTFLLLFLFLLLVRPNIRYLLLILVSLAASLLLSVIFYYALDLEFHLYSIAGWTLSIGIVLDNLIVMADHIKHQGNQNIFPAILSATLTTVGALSVIFFMEAEYRENLSDFSGVFMVNILVSLLTALVFIPALIRSIFQPQTRKRLLVRRKKRVIRFTRSYRKFIIFSCRYRIGVLLLIIFGFGLPLFLLPDQWEAKHLLAQVYNRSVGSDFYQDKIREHTDKYLGGTFRLFHKQQNKFYAKQEKQEKTKLYLKAKMPFGGTKEQLNEIIQSIEVQLDQYKEIDKYQSWIYGATQSSIEVTFKDQFDDGVFPYVLKEHLERLAIETGSADFSVYGVGMGFSNEVQGARLSMQVQLLGYNYEDLWRLAHQTKDDFLSHRRIQKAFINSERTYFEPKEEYFQISLPQIAELQQSQLTPSQIGGFLKELELEKGTAITVSSKDRIYPINLYAAATQQNQLWNLQNYPYSLDSNQIYKHAQYLKLKRERGQQKIIRLNQQYQLIVAYDYIGNQQRGQEVMEQKMDSLKQQFPLGYTIQEFGGNSYWSSKKGQRKLLQILCAAILLIFMINAVLFNSLRQALIPLLLIPPAFIGVFLCVAFFNFRFDQGGFASFLLVAGLSVNAALFIINDYNNYRNANSHISDLTCFLKAFNAKVIPIVLTSLSTILGLLPFVLLGIHQPFWYALAICTIGGLVFSSLAVYLFFPSLFLRKSSLPKAQVL